MARPTLPPLHSLNLPRGDIPLNPDDLVDTTFLYASDSQLFTLIHQSDQIQIQCPIQPLQLPPSPRPFQLSPALPVSLPAVYSHSHNAPVPTPRVILLPLWASSKTVPRDRCRLRLTPAPFDTADVIFVVKPTCGSQRPPVQLYMGLAARDLLARRVRDLPQGTRLRPYRIVRFDPLNPFALRPIEPSPGNI